MRCFKYFFCNSVYSRCFKSFWGFANTLLHIRVKMENKVKKILNPLYSIQIIFLCCPRGLLFLKWSYSQRCSDIAQRFSIHSEDENAVLTLLNVVQIKLKIENVDSMLISFQHRINHKYFSWSFFDVTFPTRHVTS